MQAVLRNDGRDVLGYGPPAGHPPLRRFIAGEMRQRGMHVSEEEIVVTNGSQQAIDLIARALVDPGDGVLVENPTYLGAVQVFQSYGAEIDGIPVDSEGAMVSVVPDAIERRRPKLLYLMPNFQNPTSRTMSRSRRESLAAVLASGRVVVVEDDFGGELRYEGEDLPTLKSLDRGGCVVYLSTFGKKLLPGLRVGWLAAPQPLAERIAHLKKISDYSTSVLLQAALHEFCRRGELRRHLGQVVGHYRERRDAMLAALEDCFPRSAEWTRPEGGLVVWVTLPDGVGAEDVAAEASAQGVLVGCGDLFYLGRPRRENLRLAFSQASPVQIRDGVGILGQIINRKIAVQAGRKNPPEQPLPLI